MSAQSLSIKPGTQEPRRLLGVFQPDSIESLELRLVDGYHRIDVARAQGEDVAAWEEFWIELLHQYEALCDGVQAAA